MKLYQLINKEKMLLSFIKFSQLIIRKMFGVRKVRKICMSILELRGLKREEFFQKSRFKGEQF